MPFLLLLDHDCPEIAVHRLLHDRIEQALSIGKAIAISASLPIVADRGDESEGEGSRECSGGTFFYLRISESFQRTVVKNIYAPLLPMSIEVHGIFR